MFLYLLNSQKRIKNKNKRILATCPKFPSSPWGKLFLWKSSSLSNNLTSYNIELRIYEIFWPEKKFFRLSIFHRHLTNWGPAQFTVVFLRSFLLCWSTPGPTWYIKNFRFLSLYLPSSKTGCNNTSGMKVSLFQGHRFWYLKMKVTFDIPSTLIYRIPILFQARSAYLEWAHWTLSSEGHTERKDWSQDLKSIVLWQNGMTTVSEVMELPLGSSNPLTLFRLYPDWESNPRPKVEPGSVALRESKWCDVITMHGSALT